MPTYSLYMGCSVPANYPNYEAAMLLVAERFGMELRYMNDVGCCGSPNLHDIDYMGWLIVNGRTLAIAEKEGHDIVTPCNGCFRALKEVHHILKNDDKKRNEINSKLKDINLEFRGTIRPRHFIEVLYTDIGIEEIKKKITKPLDGVGIAIHIGCHLLRPAEVTEFKPEIFQELLEVTGAKVIDYPLWHQCCGATVFPVDESLAIQLARDKLKSITGAGALFATVICPACANQLDLIQLGLIESHGENYNLPILFYPQILGLAMGLNRENLGLEMNRVPADPILDHLHE